MEYRRFISKVARRRDFTEIYKQASRVAESPRKSDDIIFLGGGVPNVETLPFSSAEFTLNDGSHFSITGNEMNTAQTYSQFCGSPDLLQWIKQLLKSYHNPPTMRGEDGGDGDLSTIITCGSQDALCKSVELLSSEGDNLICEDYAYYSFFNMLRPLNCKAFGVESDSNGMKPESLRKLLSRWKPEDKDNEASDIPRVLYTVPVGANPTGATYTLSRKKEIYQIAQEYNLIILEDDPYYYLQYESALVPSFLSLDTDGRVIRFDSFSKVISSGLRIGYMSGPRILVNKVIMHSLASVMSPPSFSQMLLLKLFNIWGLDGFREHMKRLRTKYRKQRDQLIGYLEKWLRDYCEWEVPRSGFYAWLKVKELPDTKYLIQNVAVKEGVVLIPGHAFSSNPELASPFMRMSFSEHSPEEMDKGLQRLASAIKEVLREQNVSLNGLNSWTNRK